MPRYAAFLRAINVGGRQAPKDTLRAACEDAGGTHVETLLASGNLAFDSRRAERDIVARLATALAARLGFEVDCFVRRADEMESIAAHVAELAASDATLFVVFLAAPPQPSAWERLRAQATAEDRFYLRGREIYWQRAGGFADSPFSGAVLEKLLAAPATVRKSTTVLKMVAKTGAAP